MKGREKPANRHVSDCTKTELQETRTKQMKQIPPGGYEMNRSFTDGAYRLLVRAFAGMLSLTVLNVSYAQDEAIEEIVVTAIRGSMMQSMDIRRNNNGVVDAISAQDIGKFPDTNLAESLQRITGVSIDRRNNEGNQITVRGLGPNFNMVTLNGRQMPVASSPEQESISSATQSRAFNFAEIASESVIGVNVYKTARPNVPTGGMGATVDILTARPFNYSEPQIFVSATAIHDSSVERGDSITPELAGFFSTTLADGKIGLLTNLSYSRRDFSELSTHSDGWLRDEPKGSPTDNDGPYEFWCNGPGSQCGNAPYVYRPVTNISEIQHNSRERTNAQFVAQFAPTDELVLTVDYVLSRFNRDQDRYQTGLFGVVADGVENTRLTDTFTVASASRTSNVADIAADAIVYENELVIENDSIGFNIDWQVNDTLNIDFDAHTSKAVSQPGGEISDNTQILQGPLGINFDLDYYADGVNIAVDDSGAFRGEDQFGQGTPRPGVDEFQSVNGFSPLGSVIRRIAIDNQVDQFQLEGNWDFEDVVLTAGVSYTDYQVETNALSSGFVFQDLDACNGCAEVLSRDIINPPSGFNVVNQFPVNALVAQTFPIQIADIIAANPPTFFGASEESIALFFNIESDFDIGNMPARLSAGFRYETTDVTGSAFQTFPTSLTITTSTEGVVNFDPDAEPELFTVKGDYDIFLPAIDFQIEPVEDFVVRMSYGESIARPDLNALRPIATVSDYRPGTSTAAGGNPTLRPYSADNIDLAAEWYYDAGSYATITYFYKKVDDYIVTDVVNDVFLDDNGDPLLDPQGRFDPTIIPNVPVTSAPGDPEADFAFSRPLNSAERSVDGWEFAIQHMFGESGFGMQANYTIVNSDAEYDPSNFQQQAILIGLSDSANLVGFYETDVWSVRLAANWRDEFLFAENQLRSTNEPVYFKEYLQLDLSTSYSFNENYQVIFEVLNMTGEDQRQRGRYPEQYLLENNQYARYNFGIRANF
jgi:TonB-dependent receptor